MTDDSMEPLADAIIDDLRACINTEEQFITKKHELHAKLEAAENVFVHLEYAVPQELTHVHDLNHEVSHGILNIRRFIELSDLNDIAFIKESKKNKDALATDVEHRDWQAVRSDIDRANPEMKKTVRVEKERLKRLHDKIHILMKKMKKSELLSALDEDMALNKKKEDYVKKEEYYFVEVYKFLRAYERILRHLWRKEEKLVRHLEKDASR